MKFISKSANLLVVLRPGLSAQPLTGTPAKPTVSVRFKDGIADVQQEEIVAMMISHPGFQGDFICADDIKVDPYASSHRSPEPEHVITEIKYGTPVSRINAGANQNLSPEMQKIIQDTATEMAKAMLPSLVENALKGIIKEHEDGKKEIVYKKKGKAGRKPKLKNKIIEDEPLATENPNTEESVSL